MRSSPGQWLGEVVATAGLIAVIFALARTGRAGMSAAAVAAYIGAASAPGFIAAQLLGAALGTGLVTLLYSDTTLAAETKDAARPVRIQP